MKKKWSEEKSFQLSRGKVLSNDFSANIRLYTKTGHFFLLSGDEKTSQSFYMGWYAVS